MMIFGEKQLIFQVLQWLEVFSYQPNLLRRLGGGQEVAVLDVCCGVGGSLRGRRLGKLGVDGCGVDLWVVTDITILNQDYYF